MGRLLHELLSIFPSDRFEFRCFQKMFKSLNDFGRLAAKQSDRDVINASFTRGFIYFKNYEGSCRPVLYKKELLETPWRQVLMAGDKEVFSVVLNLYAAVEQKLYFIW